MKRRAWRLSLAAALFGLAAASCADLEKLDPGACGNQVIDANEDCDGHVPEPGTVCAAPSSPHSCRYACSADISCPPEFGCGEDGVCRRPSGAFKKRDAEVPFAAYGDLRVLDYDVDGSLDALLLGPADALGHRPARIIRPSVGLGPDAVEVLPMSIAAVAVGDVESAPDSIGSGLGLAAADHTHDVAFADFGGVTVFHGLEIGHLTFSAFPSLVPPGGAAQRAIPVDVVPETPGDELVFLVQRPDMGGALERLPGALAGAVLTPMPAGEEDLAGEVHVGRLDEASPCKTIVMAFSGATEVLTFTPCRKDAAGVGWNVGGALSHVTLPPGATVGRGVFPADVDLDGHLDLVIDASGETFVAWGLGDGTFLSKNPGGEVGAAAPYTLPALAAGEGGPLAIADLNGDGLVDYVMPFGVVTSEEAGSHFAFRNFGVPWDEALIGDFNGNGLLDVVAGSAAAINVVFLNNAGGGSLNETSISTEGPVSHLAMGDFDGDLLTDVAFTEELTQEDVVADRVVVAFGSAYGAPKDILELGRLEEIEAMTPAHISNMPNVDAVSDLVVVSEDPKNGTDSLFQFQGQTSRVMFAPFTLRSDKGESSLPIALGLGRFQDPTADIAALGVDTQTGALRLWAIEAFETFTSTSARASAPLSSSFHPTEGNALNFRYGAALAVGDLGDDGIPEAVVAAPWGEAASGAALLVADYDKSLEIFSPRPEQPFSADLSVDSLLTLEDVDGDGFRDALLTTGTALAPGELLLFFGDGMGGLATDTFAHIRPANKGVRSVASFAAKNGRGRELLVAGEDDTFFVRVEQDRAVHVVPAVDLPAAKSVSVGDFDRDGLPDILLLAEDGVELFVAIPVLP